MDRLGIVKRLDALQSAIFTRQQFASITGKNPAYASVMLSRLVRDGVVVRVKRGVYCLPDAHPFCVASGESPRSYVSLWAAFGYHGMTTQIPDVIEVVNAWTSGPLRLELDSGSYRLIRIRTKPGWLFGMEKVMFNGKTALVAERERAIIDGLLFPGRLPVDDVFEALKTGVKGDRLVSHARTIGRQSVMKRLGYLMSLAGLTGDLDGLAPLSPTYVPLDPLGPRRGRYDPQWRIMVNMEVV